MIKKLRMKLIALSMCSLLLVLVLILGSIHVVSYLGIVEDADAVLAILAENGGRFPKTNNHKKNPDRKSVV